MEMVQGPVTPETKADEQQWDKIWGWSRERF